MNQAISAKNEEPSGGQEGFGRQALVDNRQAGIITLKSLDNGTTIEFSPLHYLDSKRFRICKSIQIRFQAKSGILNETIATAKRIATKSTPPSLPDDFIKCYISTPGYYCISGKELEELGLSLKDINISALHLSRRLEDIPLILRNHENGFNTESTLEFYIDKLSNPWSEQNCNPFALEDALILSWDGSQGLRYVQQSATIGNSIDYRPKHYQQSVHIEKNDIFVKLGQLAVDTWSDQNEHHFNSQSISAGKSSNFKFNLNWPAAAQKSVRIRTKFQGISYGSSEDHVITLLMNDAYVSQSAWKGQTAHIIDNDANNYNHSNLNHGENNLQVVISGDPSITQYYDYSYLDWI
ncbi:MAG: hypothetical protein KAI81_08210, partial [Candidatus Marinimicrobia bacterium]|nr:hypothetical protein [Candidatus Neomarinimicrobiota bacterium]